MEPAEGLGLCDEPDPAVRLARIRSEAQGRVVEISGEADLAGADGGCDTVVVCSTLHRAASPGRLISALIGLLAEPDGIIWFLEPSAGSDDRGDTVDVPRELRRRGLFVTDLDRFEATGGDGAMWVEGKARRSRRRTQPS